MSLGSSFTALSRILSGPEPRVSRYFELQNGGSGLSKVQDEWRHVTDGPVTFPESLFCRSSP